MVVFLVSHSLTIVFPLLPSHKDISKEGRSFKAEGLGKLMNTIKSIQNIQNPQLDIEGLLLTMYDSRLRLSNLVIDEVKTHFQDMVFKTIIQRNVRLSEAPSYGESIIMYDATCRGAINYLNLAQEFIDKNETAA